MVAPVMVGEQYRATWHLSGGDTWPTNNCLQAWQVRVRGRRVSGTRSECMDLCQSLAIMRRLVNGKKTKIPLDLAI
ncbi:hypothetical protein Tco_1013507 [Tanacetum coccineum]